VHTVSRRSIRFQVCFPEVDRIDYPRRAASTVPSLWEVSRDCRIVTSRPGVEPLTHPAVTFSTLWARLFTRKETKVLILGLDNAGKVSRAGRFLFNRISWVIYMRNAC
jgi:hypothetical protein